MYRDKRTTLLVLALGEIEGNGSDVLRLETRKFHTPEVNFRRKKTGEGKLQVENGKAILFCSKWKIEKSMAVKASPFLSVSILHHPEDEEG